MEDRLTKVRALESGHRTVQFLKQVLRSSQCPSDPSLLEQSLRAHEWLDGVIESHVFQIQELSRSGSESKENDTIEAQSADVSTS